MSEIHCSPVSIPDHERRVKSRSSEPAVSEMKDQSPTQKGSISTIVRSATYNPNGASSKTVTFSFERLKWNQRWSHGNDEPDPAEPSG